MSWRASKPALVVTGSILFGFAGVGFGVGLKLDEASHRSQDNRRLIGLIARHDDAQRAVLVRLICVPPDPAQLKRFHLTRADVERQRAVYLKILGAKACPRRPR